MAEAVEQVSHDLVQIRLPALPSPLQTFGSLAGQLGYVAAIAELEIGWCSLESRYDTDQVTTAACDVTIVSRYRADLGLEGTAFTVRASADATGITLVTSSFDDIEAPWEQLCIWAFAFDPVLAGPVFDDGCRPVVQPGSATAQRQLAEGYAADGGSFAGAARNPVGITEAFATIHNRGGQPEGLFDFGGAVVRFPGMPVDSPQWPHPEMRDYLLWSSRLFDFDLGECSTSPRVGEGLTAVDCPSARLAGLLPKLLGLGSVAQPMVFYVQSGKIVDVAGSTNPALVEEFTRVCGSVAALSAAAVTQFPSGECSPRFDGFGAAALEIALGCVVSTVDGPLCRNMTGS